VGDSPAKRGKRGIKALPSYTENWGAGNKGFCSCGSFREEGTESAKEEKGGGGGKEKWPERKNLQQTFALGGVGSGGGSNRGAYPEPHPIDSTTKLGNSQDIKGGERRSM